jgi:hypothetical protein
MVQQEPRTLEVNSTVKLLDFNIFAIIGQSGGQCIDPADSGSQFANDAIGRRMIIAKRPVETSLCQNRMKNDNAQ